MTDSQNPEPAMPTGHADNRSPLPVSPELPALLERLAGLLAAATCAAPMLIFLYEPESSQYTLQQTRGFDKALPAGLAFSPDSDLARWLAARDHPIHITDGDDQPPPPLDSLGLVLLIPLSGRGGMPKDSARGWVALGARPTREPYNPDDLAILASLADQAALTIENRHLLQRIAELEQAKLEFIDFVAHELKQPMTAMQGYGKMLTMGIGGKLSDRQAQFVQVINRNVDRLSRLVNNLLEISRLEAGRVTLELEQLQPGPLVEEALVATRADMEARQHSLEAHLPKDLPPCTGDRDRLVQILTNLLSNACLYTPHGGTIRVSVSEREPSGGLPGYLLFSVSDSGIGLSAEDIANLDKFYRADRDLVAAQQGAGLGISIVRHLIELHRGELVIESEVDQGSTFSFTIPLVPGDKPSSSLSKP